MDTNNSKMPILANDSLAYFIGTTTYYKHISGFYFTDGIHYARTQFQCYWLIHDILWATRNNRLPTERLLVWTLERHMVVENDLVAKRFSGFFLTCTLDNKIIYKTAIQYSDFWADKFVMYLYNEVLYLPSEE